MAFLCMPSTPWCRDPWGTPGIPGLPQKSPQHQSHDCQTHEGCRCGGGCCCCWCCRPNEILLQNADKYYHRVHPQGPPSVCVHLRSVDNFEELTREQQEENFAGLRQGLLDCAKVLFSHTRVNNSNLTEESTVLLCNSQFNSLSMRDLMVATRDSCA